MTTCNTWLLVLTHVLAFWAGVGSYAGYLYMTHRQVRVVD